MYVLVATYSEPAELVRECVLRLLAAPEPLDTEKVVVVCDDGHALAEGARKRAFVAALHDHGAPPPPCEAPCCFFRPALMLHCMSLQRKNMITKHPFALQLHCAACGVLLRRPRGPQAVRFRHHWQRLVAPAVCRVPCALLPAAVCRTAQLRKCRSGGGAA